MRYTSLCCLYNSYLTFLVELQTHLLKVKESPGMYQMLIFDIYINEEYQIYHKMGLLWGSAGLHN